MPSNNMIRGQWYKIVYKRASGQGKDEFIGQYLDTINGKYIINFRPLAGTSNLPVNRVISIEQSTQVKPQLPRKARDAE